MRTFTPRVLVAAAVAAGALAVTGCGNAVEGIAQAGVEKMVEDQTGAQIDVDDDGGVTIEGEDTSFKVGTAAELPADFPSELPIPEGTLTSVVTVGGQWMLGFEGVDAEALDKVVSYYKDQGYGTGANIVAGDSKTVYFSNDTWGVSLIWDGTAGSEQLVYSVYPTSS